MGKYDPLQRYLAGRPDGMRELTMRFAEIQQLVRQLPNSARTLESWWHNNPDASAAVRAWWMAGWRVQAVDLAAETVVFVREPGASPAEEVPEHLRLISKKAQPDEETAAATQAEVSSGVPTEEDPPPSKHVSWWTVATGLVAAFAAGATAIVGLTHLPWLALVLLAVSVGVIAFTLTQAIESRATPVEALRWWALSTVVSLLVCVGAFVYHKWLDVADRSPGLPFTAVVKVDPTMVGDQSCRTVVFPFPWRRIPTPPQSLTEGGVNKWEASQRGVDGTTTSVLVELQGRSDQAVTIGQPLVEVWNRRPPVQGSAAELSGGCGGTQQTRVFKVNLDQRYPSPRLVSGVHLPRIRSNSLSSSQASSTIFTVSVSDPEYFVIVGTAKKFSCRWSLTLPWQSLGRSGMLTIENGRKPFATTATGTNPIHYLIFGTWH